jgi:hypothetical protein
LSADHELQGESAHERAAQTGLFKSGA